MPFPLRSPRDTVHGIMVFGRILDKIRLHASEGLPPGYHLGLIDGKRTFDDRVCCLLNVSFEALTARTLEGGSDEQILEWCFTHGRRFVGCDLRQSQVELCGQRMATVTPNMFAEV
jgi:gluconokinase